MILATFFGADLLGSTSALVVAGLLGVAFGVFLEQAGFGSSRRLTGIFYLQDMAVLKVMMSAIVTAAVGLRVLVAAGLLDLAQVHQLETVLAPQVVGGLLFGVGFVTGGWCPGTALVGAASGRADALAFLAAAGLGSLGFAAAWPALSSFAREGACGVCALPETLGMPAGLVVAAVAAMALGAFVLSERLEARARARASS